MLNYVNTKLEFMNSWVKGGILNFMTNSGHYQLSFPVQIYGPSNVAKK